MSVVRAQMIHSAVFNVQVHDLGHDVVLKRMQALVF